ncbi:DUF998 domain-containing protein [Candidatus Pacearchaeota archaeon]|nr:DUF998 domain-containing protein [Candidatus Pacearchaeota archaeon]
MKINLDKILIASGFIGPIIFFITIYFLFALLYPGFNVFNQTISELGTANSPIQTLTNVFGFSLFGIFIMLFAMGLFRSKEVNYLGKISAIFIFVTGILMYLTGIFYGSSGAGLYTMIDRLHIIVSNYQFPILAVGLVLFAFSIVKNKKLRWLTPVILVLGLITLILAYVFFFTHDLQNRGIWQRAAIGLPYLILMIIAAALYKVQFKV